MIERRNSTSDWNMQRLSALCTLKGVFIAAYLLPFFFLGACRRTRLTRTRARKVAVNACPPRCDVSNWMDRWVLGHVASCYGGVMSLAQ